MSDNSFVMTQTALADLAHYALDLAKQQGATQADVGASEAHGQSVSVRNGHVDTIEYNRDKKLYLTVYLGKRKGSAETTNFSKSAIADVVNKAISVANHTAEDPFSGLASPELMPIGETLPDLDLYHPWSISPKEAIEEAKACEAAAFEENPLIQNSEGATVSSQQSKTVMANSFGFSQTVRSSRQSRSCHVIAAAGSQMQRDGWYDVARDHRDLMDITAIGKKAAQRAASRLNAKRIPTGSVPVIYEAPVAIGMLGRLAIAASGGYLYRNSSFLQDKLGKSIFPSFVNVYERPHLPKGLSSANFDADAVRTKNRDVVKEGILTGYFLSAYSARKLNMETTGNAGGSHNLILSDTGHSFDDLLKLMNRGLLITEVLGQGVNYVTGNYSRGVSGFWVDHGEIQFPVEEITVAGNLNDMFRNVIAIGNDTVIRGGKQSGSVLMESVMVAGTNSD